jgi:hypothetical protein
VQFPSCRHAICWALIDGIEYQSLRLAALAPAETGSAICSPVPAAPAQAVTGSVDEVSATHLRAGGLLHD